VGITFNLLSQAGVCFGWEVTSGILGEESGSNGRVKQGLLSHVKLVLLGMLFPE
jgi:hypothetical protein